MSRDIYEPSTKAQNAKHKVLILTTDKVHDLEFFYPLYRLTEEGCQVDVASPGGGEVEGKFGMSLSETKKIGDVKVSDYELLYIPGGSAPEALRKDEDALELVREFDKAGKLIAPMCHGAQVIISAGLAKGKRLAAWPDVSSEIEEAGGEFVNAPSVQDGKYISARWPGDLPAHLASVLVALGLRKEHVLERAA